MTSRLRRGRWKVKYEPIPAMAFSNLRYDRWVKERLPSWLTSFPAVASDTCTSSAMDQPSPRRSSRKTSANFRHKRRAWSSTSAGTAGGTSSKSSWGSWFSAHTRFGNPAGSSQPSGRSTATSGPRSSCKTGEARPMQKCSQPDSALWAWARSLARPPWARSSVLAATRSSTDHRSERPESRRFPLRHGPDQHGKPRRPARRPG